MLRPRRWLKEANNSSLSIYMSDINIGIYIYGASPVEIEIGTLVLMTRLGVEELDA